MLRYLFRSLRLTLEYQPVQIQLQSAFNQQRYTSQLQLSRKFHNENFMNQSLDVEKHETPAAAPDPITGETDGEYIVAYQREQELCASRTMLIEVLCKKLRLTKSEATSIACDESFKRAFKDRSLLQSIEILIAKGVAKSSFLDFPWLATLDKTSLNKKLVLLNTMPIRDINHFVAFLRLSVPRLIKLVNTLNRESTIIPQSNRIYYISEKLNTDPYIVSKYLSRRLFVLEMSWDQLELNLENMIEFNVSPLNVLRDLWAFRYTPKAVQLRFERATNAKKDKIMPWMVRCSEQILQRSFKLSLDELEVLGDRTVVEYVADRLYFDVEETRAIMQKHPKVFHVRVTKIKEVLDYLLDEACFTRFEVAQNPRILCHSLETTKQRINELKSYGCRPSSLVIVCRSKREYQKFVEKWLETMKYRSTKARGKNVADTNNTDDSGDSVNT